MEKGRPKNKVNLTGLKNRSGFAKVGRLPQAMKKRSPQVVRGTHPTLASGEPKSLEFWWLVLRVVGIAQLFQRLVAVRFRQSLWGPAQ
jgi:hypothetical protein